MTPELKGDLILAQYFRDRDWELRLEKIQAALLRQAKRLLEAHTQQEEEK